MFSYKTHMKDARIRHATLKDFKREWEQTSADERCYVEVLAPLDKPVKPYADYDRCYEIEPEEGKIAAIHKDNIKNLLKKYPKADIGSSSNHRLTDSGFKVSFHYIVNGYRSTVKDIQLTMKSIAQYNSFWDTSPYNNKQCFRIGGCHKNETDKPILMNYDNDLDKHLIQALAGDEEQCPTLFIPPDVSTTTDVDTEHMERVVELLADNNIVHYNNGVPTDNGFQFPQISGKHKPRQCPSCNKKHLSNSFYINIRSNNDVHYQCLSGKANGKSLLLGRLNPDVLDVSYMGDLEFNIERVQKDFITDAPAPYDHEDDTKRPLFLEYMNRFFRHVDGKINDVARLTYNDNGSRKEIDRRMIKEWEHNLGKPFQKWFHSGKANKARKYRCLPYDNHNPDELNMMPTITCATWDIELREGDMAVIEPILYHIRHVFSMENVAVNEYLLNAMARPLQASRYGNDGPCKLGMIILLCSPPGCGKSTMFGGCEYGLGLFPRMYGDAHGTITKMTELIGDWTGTFMKKFFIWGEDVGGFGKVNAAALRGLATNPTAKSSQKYEKDIADLDDKRNYWLSTNEKMTIDLDDNRKVLALYFKHLPLFLKDGMTKNPEWIAYYKQYGEACMNDDVVRAFYRYLMSRDLSEFVPSTIPITSFQQDIAKSQCPPMKGFALEMFSTTGCVIESEYDEDGRKRSHYGIHKGYVARFNKNNDWEYISTATLFDVFKSWAFHNNEKIDWITKPKLMTDWTTSGGVVSQQRCPFKKVRVRTINVEQHPLFNKNTDAEAYYDETDEIPEPPTNPEF